MPLFRLDLLFLVVSRDFAISLSCGKQISRAIIKLSMEFSDIYNGDELFTT